MGVRQLSRFVGLSAPTTYNLLKTLQARSFVESNIETRQYRLGLGAIRLGEAADPHHSMQVFGRPYIEALATEFDETVVVLTWEDGQAIVVDWIQAEHPLAVTHNQGVVEHPILFASGRVLLAFQPRVVQLRYAAREDLGRLGPNSPRTAEEMVKLLDGVASDGFAITKNVRNSGIAAVAVPVFDTGGHAIMAVGCSAPLSRTTDEQIATVLARLREMAKEMTSRMGGSIPSERSPAA
jgi:IclR family transcriptional regulator, KDG regulon repressor